MAYQLPFDSFRGAGTRSAAQSTVAVLNQPMPLDARLRLTYRRRRSERIREIASTAGWVAGSSGLLVLGAIGVLGLK